MGRVWRDMELFKVLAARGGAEVVELKYHERGGVSSVNGGEGRGGVGGQEFLASYALG